MGKVGYWGKTVNSALLYFASFLTFGLWLPLSIFALPQLLCLNEPFAECLLQKCVHNVFQIFHQRPHSPFVIRNKPVSLTSKLKFDFLNVNKLKRKKEKKKKGRRKSSHAVTWREYKLWAGENGENIFSFCLWREKINSLWKDQST